MNENKESFQKTKNHAILYFPISSSIVIEDNLKRNSNQKQKSFPEKSTMKKSHNIPSTHPATSR